MKPMPDDEVSTFEELYPESTRNAVPTRRLEMRLGLLIVAVIACWGVWSWWQGQGQIDNYRQGEAAAEANNWEQAADFFAKADGYSDAAEQARTARLNIAERNRHYQIASGAQRNENWIEMLRELRTVQEIQPNFRQTEALLVEAEALVYTSALSGTVAMRHDAEPAGLYLRSAEGWLWLERSDGRSRVRSYTDCGYYLYDVEPDPADGPIPRRTPTRQDQESGLLGRKLVAVRFSEGRQVVSEFDFDPAYYSSIFCMKSGVLAFQYGQSTGFEDALTDNYEEVVYQGLDDEQSRQVDTTQQAIVAVDTGRDRLLVATLEVGDFEHQTVSYSLMNLADGSLQPISRQNALPISAAISPDGKQAVLFDHEPVKPLEQTTAGERYAIKVISLERSNWTSWVFAELVDEQELQSPYRPSYYLSYVTRGVHQGKIMLLRFGENQRIWLIDNKLPYKVLWTSGAPEGGSISNLQPLENGLVVGWSDQSCITGLEPSEAAGETVFVGANYEPTVVQSQLNTTQTFYRIWERGDRMIYIVDANCWSDPRAFHLNSIAAADFVNGIQQPTELLTLTFEDFQQGYIAPGAGSLAYLDKDKLMVRDFEGGEPLLLESRVVALYRTEP